jgi:hypothetical protein
MAHVVTSISTGSSRTPTVRDRTRESDHNSAVRAMVGERKVRFMIAIPVPAWAGLILAVLGIIAWTYDLLIVKPKRRRERLARKRSL